MMIQEEHYIQKGADSQQIQDRNNKQPVLKTEITDFVIGITRTVYTQEKTLLRLQN